MLYKKIFTNHILNKKWSIEIDGQTIRTCLNNGKIKEITFDNEYKLKSKASSEMMGKLCKGFSYHNKDAKFGEVKCYQFVGRAFNGFMPIATSTEYEDFFVTRIVGDFEDEILYHFDEDGNILEKVSLGAKRMTYNQVLCANITILMNNSYLIEQFFLENKDIKPFANKKDSFKSMLDAKSELALWYTGEEIVVFDFKNNKQIWREQINCEETGKSFKSHYCEALISPQQTKVAYRIAEQGYIIVDLKSYEKIVIENSDWHPFFSPDDKYFSVGGKVYTCQTGEETSNPFPFDIKQGLTYFDTFEVKIRENLIAIQQGRGNSPIEIWDYHNRKMLAKIEDEFIVKHASFDFTKSSLVVHTDYGIVSVYNCKE